MRQRDRVTIIAAALGIATSVLAIGGAPRWSLAVIAVPTLVAVAAQLTSRRAIDRVPPLLAVLGIALGLTVVQAVPLPSTARASLDPINHNLIEEGRAMTGDGPSRLAPLSLDPPATRRAALDLALAFALAWVLLRTASSAQGRYWILAAVASTCGLAAIIGAVEQLIGGTALYGLYTPHHASPTVLGPLLNSNSYGSLLVLGAMVSIGLALHRAQPNALRALWMFNVFGCLAVAFETLSRGAALAAGIGLATTGIAWFSARRVRDSRDRRRPHLLRVTAPAIVIVLCSFALLVLTSAGGVTQQLEDTSIDEASDPMSKFAAWRSSAQLVNESPWIGVGRGGFEVSFTRVHPESAFGTFSHVENEYLQAVIDWGIPGAAALAIAVGWLALLAFRRRSDGPMAAAAIGGLAAVAAQATVDFGLEFPGLMVPTVAVAATLSYGVLREVNPSRVKRAFAGRLLLAGGIIAGVIAVVPSWGETLADDHDALEAEDPPTFAHAVDVMRRHPLDYFAPARAAVALFETGDPSAIKFLNRALEMHPTHAGLHRLAARILAGTGHDAQAKLEFQIAMKYTQDPTLVVGEILKAFPKVDDATAALWIEFPRPEVLARTLGEWKRPDVMLRYLQKVAAGPGLDVSVIDLLWPTAIAIGDLETAEAGVRLRLAKAPDVRSRFLLGRVLRMRNKLDEAEAALKDTPTMPGAPTDVTAAWMLLCEVQIDRKELPDADQCLRKLASTPALPVSTLRDIHALLAQVADDQGDKYRAAMERSVAAGLQ